MNTKKATSISTPRLPLRSKGALALIRISSSLVRLINKLTRPIVPISNAFGLGLLRKDQVEQLVQYTYATHPDFYNPGNYDNKWEEDIIAPLKKTTSSNRLLVAFCGKGREAEIFASHGYEVTGIDREPFMIDGAIKFSQERGYKANFKCVDFDDYKADSPYGIVYTSTWMYTTYLDPHDRADFLEKCRTLCSPNGVIVISYCIRKDNFLDALMHKITTLVAFLTRGNKTAVKGDRIERGLFWHYFTHSEIEQELEAAGMETIFLLPTKSKDWEWRFIRPVRNSLPLQ